MRARMVTRTINLTEVDVMAYDTKEKKVIEDTVSLYGLKEKEAKDNKVLEKHIELALREGLKFLEIKTAVTVERLYEMEESVFIKYATVREGGR